MEPARAEPTVTIAVPVLDEEAQIDLCLSAIDAQTYVGIVEVLVIDGGSLDATRKVAEAHPLVRVVDNPGRSRPAAMNIALREARGAIIVRVDARTLVERDYVERCVAALVASRAAIVGGPMRLATATATATERGVQAAMTSRVGGGPAAFRRDGGRARYVDTVYLGAYWRDAIAELGGYDEVFGGNEDAELAYRAQSAGGVYLDPAIRSRYAVRSSFGGLAAQYFRYGQARARTVRKHPRSLAPRQLALPLLCLALLSPWRSRVLTAYLTVVVARAAAGAPRDPGAALATAAALPTMHGAWVAGFAKGLARPKRALSGDTVSEHPARPTSRTAWVTRARSTMPDHRRPIL